MRILIVSKEVWRNDQNGGNTLTMMFSNFPPETEIAQIYCSEGNPNNTICSKYYKLSTRDVVKSIRNGNIEAGSVIEKKETDESEQNASIKKSFLSGLTNNEVLRDLIWKTGRFKSEKLKKYIKEFNPDIIYAPGYGVHYMNYLIQWIASFMDTPIVSLISDDYYSFNQVRINPFFWIRLIGLRRNIRRSVRCYDLIYTMTDMQKKQLEKDFGVPVNIIRKGYQFEKKGEINKETRETLHLVYAGNLYYNRWKTLYYIQNAVADINAKAGREKYFLDLYSNGALNSKFQKLFNIKGVSEIHRSVPYSEIMRIYSNSDMAIHAESFDLVNRKKVQMSFSTKIIDCMASGCAILCVCDKSQSGFLYLKENNIAICIDNKDEIIEKLEYLYDNQSGLNELRNKAYLFGVENHDIQKVSSKLYNDFLEIIAEKI